MKRQFFLEIEPAKGLSLVELRRAIKEAVDSTDSKFVTFNMIREPDPYQFKDPDNPPRGLE